MNVGTIEEDQPVTAEVDFAILAPVPLEHLIAGLEVCSREGFVAYGSLKWELFETIDRLRGGFEVPVLLYPSGDDHPVFDVCWTASYIGHVRSLGGVHPDGMRYRPSTALNYENDRAGFWAIFWHVAALKKLGGPEAWPISSLASYKSGSFWKAGHPPRGPELVVRPSWV